MVACEVSSPVINAPSTPTSDRVATHVAETKTRFAEETAVAATFTAEAPKVNQIPSKSKTPEPTLTRIPSSPTAANARANTPTATLTRVWDLVQSGIYGIKVISVEKVYSFVLPSRFVYPESGQDFLQVEVEIYKDGVPLFDFKSQGQENLEFSIADSKGQVYNVKYSAMMGAINSEGYFTPTHHKLVFTVPNVAAGFRLRYRDLPLIDLGL
jgi:hypothetical protein